MSAVFVMGMLWKRTTWQAALTVMLVGIPLSLVLEYLVLQEGFNFFNLVGITWCLCMILLVVISLMTPRPSSEATTGTLWNRSMLELPQEDGARLPFYKRPSIWWAGAGTIWVTIYIILW